MVVVLSKKKVTFTPDNQVRIYHKEDPPKAVSYIILDTKIIKKLLDVFQRNPQI